VPARETRTQTAPAAFLLDGDGVPPRLRGRYEFTTRVANSKPTWKHASEGYWLASDGSAWMLQRANMIGTRAGSMQLNDDSIMPGSNLSTWKVYCDGRWVQKLDVVLRVLSAQELSAHAQHEQQVATQPIMLEGHGPGLPPEACGRFTSAPSPVNDRAAWQSDYNNGQYWITYADGSWWLQTALVKGQPKGFAGVNGSAIPPLATEPWLISSQDGFVPEPSLRCRLATRADEPPPAPPRRPYELTLDELHAAERTAASARNFARARSLALHTDRLMQLHERFAEAERLEKAAVEAHQYKEAARHRADGDVLESEAIDLVAAAQHAMHNTEAATSENPTEVCMGVPVE